MSDVILKSWHLEALCAALERVRPELNGEAFDQELSRVCEEVVFDRRGNFIWRAFELGKKLFICLSEAQNWRCCYCGIRTTRHGSTGATIEHVTAKCIGGADHPDNLAMACYDCNSARAPHSAPMG